MPGQGTCAPPVIVTLPAQINAATAEQAAGQISAAFAPGVTVVIRSPGRGPRVPHRGGDRMMQGIIDSAGRWLRCGPACYRLLIMASLL